MSHLSIEPSEPSRERGDARSAEDHIDSQRLAALADEQPAADERDHLDHCASCSQEIDAHRSLLAIAGLERGTLGIPLSRWETLSRRLREEGLILTEPASVTAEWAAPIGRRLSGKSWLRVAAAVMLVASGAVIGRASTGAPILPGGLTGAEAASQSARGGGPRSGLDSLPAAFASVDEATRFRTFYADGYQRAVSFLAANDSSARPTETPAVMRARLSALDRVSKTISEALNDAPFDPVINDFYLNSFGQREATLRQLNTVLPRNVRLNSF